MIGRGRFFQRAELDPKWPICFLIIVIGMILSIFEGSLGLWSALYGSTPLLDLPAHHKVRNRCKVFDMVAMIT